MPCPNLWSWRVSLSIVTDTISLPSFIEIERSLADSDSNEFFKGGGGGYSRNYLIESTKFRNIEYGYYISNKMFGWPN